MKLIFVQSIIWLAYAFGLCLGLGFCLAVGTVLGYSFNHAPISGLLCGFVWWSVGYFHTAGDSLQRVTAKIEAIKAIA